MNITRSEIPSKSLLRTKAKSYNYTDCYCGNVLDPTNQVSPVEIARVFFSSTPKWIDNLFSFRNRVVKVFGLKTPINSGDRETLLQNFNGEPGEQLGLFRVYNKTAEELILGEDDKHLDFRVSLFLTTIGNAKSKTISISTVVKFNNSLGRLYFLPVKPFHKIIVRSILKRTIKKLEKK